MLTYVFQVNLPPYLLVSRIQHRLHSIIELPFSSRKAHCKPVHTYRSYLAVRVFDAAFSCSEVDNITINPLESHFRGGQSRFLDD